MIRYHISVRFRAKRLTSQIMIEHHITRMSLLLDGGDYDCSGGWNKLPLLRTSMRIGIGRTSAESRRLCAEGDGPAIEAWERVSIYTYTTLRGEEDQSWLHNHSQHNLLFTAIMSDFIL